MGNITILGEIAAGRDETSVLPVRGPKMRRLVAALAHAAPGSAEIGVLLEALWPSGGATDQAGALRTCVSRLRSVLGPGSIEVSPRGYALNLEVVCVDALLFEEEVRVAGIPGPRPSSKPSLTPLSDTGRAAPQDEVLQSLSVALDRWRGDPYAELGADPMFMAAATALSELFIAAQQQYCAARIASGYAGAALVDLERLRDAAPLRDEPVRLLMLARDAVGDRVGALRAFEAHRRLLAEQAGLDPSPALRALERRLLLGQAPERPMSAPSRALGVGARPVGCDRRAADSRCWDAPQALGRGPRSRRRPFS